MNKLTYLDDCQLDQFILKKILSRFGSSYEVKCTASGNEVITVLSQNRLDKDKLPDIILLDIYMPGFDGWDFLDKMQSIYQTLASPPEVYILSASKYPADIERLKRYSCVKAFILKPITKEVLQKLIRQRESRFTQFSTLEAQN
jgi:CheY-like chemotaxis protein